MAEFEGAHTHKAGMREQAARHRASHGHEGVIKHAGSGYKLLNKSTGKEDLSKHPQSKAKALSQLRAIEAHKHGRG